MTAPKDDNTNKNTALKCSNSKTRTSQNDELAKRQLQNATTPRNNTTKRHHERRLQRAMTPEKQRLQKMTIPKKDSSKKQPPKNDEPRLDVGDEVEMRWRGVSPVKLEEVEFKST
ncbi:hypothetical protein C2G38_2169943 [Gigaspora rosea]|uniref:Uncharacterized protein n=1 Tax=Gigaspora rosea TaxID=44941 RepID=A0A397VY48_9GLOM|nr:hypothetical protein C2G38_2169943 [Gigaspora rosea]